MVTKVVVLVVGPECVLVFLLVVHGVVVFLAVVEDLPVVVRVVVDLDCGKLHSFDVVVCLGEEVVLWLMLVVV